MKYFYIWVLPSLQVLELDGADYTMHKHSENCSLASQFPNCMYPPKSYILTFHHSHERWRVLLRGSVRFLGRYNHSKCMHWYTRNLKIKSQTHSQIKNNLSNWPSHEALTWRYVSTEDLHSTLSKLSVPCYLLVWPV